MMENEREIGIYVRIREESTNTGMSVVVLYTLTVGHIGDCPYRPCREVCIELIRIKKD